ncbi:mRNA interferase toxin YafQ [Firmicutes bacterium ASF500]|nr:mRNA interferase toxin YafQ [Firmicutes bacterium ASF500]
MYTVKPTSKFQRDVKRAEWRGYDISLLTNVIKILAAGEALPKKYKDHDLIGDYIGFRECHITPDWLLVYRIDRDHLILVLTRTGTHSDLF